VSARLRWRALVRGIVVGLPIGVLTGLFGVGGGFVVVPTLVLVLGLDMTAAVGTSLLVIGFNAAVALLVRAPSGFDLDWSVVLPFAVAGVAGAVLGETGARAVSNRLLRRTFAVLLVALAVFLLVEQLMVR
jgi:uncharacterized membrane protein YfcA